MADINIDGVVTWLKNWFYDKTEIGTLLNAKANLNQNQANYNVVTDASGNITVEAKPTIPTDVSDLTDTNNTTFTPKSHTHGQITNDGKITSTAVTVASEDNIVITDASDSSKVKRVANLLASHIKDSSAYTHIGSSANDTQATINSKIDTALSNLSSIQAIQIVTTLPTASSSTMGKLYIINENSKVNVYYTEENDGSYSWHKMDTDILDELSIDWSDVQNKPLTFTPSSHAHGNLDNSGKVLINNTMHGDWVVITDANGYLSATEQLGTQYVKDTRAYTNIDSSANSSQYVINGKIDTALGTKGALTDDVDWTYNSNDFTNGIKLVSKTDNANGRITLHLKS